MSKLIQIDFPHDGPYGDQMAEAFKELAASIAGEPGCIWKIWTENESTQEGGGIYLFEDDETARTFLDMHMARLKSFGVSDARARIFDVNEALSKITNAPIP